MLMQGKMSVRIDNTLKSRFNRICDEVGVSCSEMLRRVILLTISRDNRYAILRKDV